MRARIAGNTTTAAVSRVRLRVDVQAVSPRGAVAAAAPAAEVAYVLLVVGAELDTTGRYRYIPDIAVITDAAALSVAKPFTDSAATNDAATRATTKALADSVTLQEYFLATLVFLRDFADTASVSDAAPVLSVSKELLDSASTTDALNVVVDKFLADGVAMNDSFDLSDGALWAFSKSVVNVVFVSDAATLSTNKENSDMITVQDAGSLRSQGYCDFSYFAEDYVGDSRTF